MSPLHAEFQAAHAVERERFAATEAAGAQVGMPAWKHAERQWEIAVCARDRIATRIVAAEHPELLAGVAA